MLSLYPRLGSRILPVLIFHSALCFVGPAGVCFCQSHRSCRLENLPCSGAEAEGGKVRTQGRSSSGCCGGTRAVVPLPHKEPGQFCRCLAPSPDCACHTLSPFCPPDKAFSQLLSQPLCSPWKVAPCRAAEPEPVAASAPCWDSCCLPCTEEGMCTMQPSLGAGVGLHGLLCTRPLA